MRGLLFALLLLAACFARTGVARATTVPLEKAERVQINGQTYVRLRDWAAASDFNFAWVTPRKSVRVSNAGLSLSFSHDSKLMSVNGVSIWLSYPAQLRDDKFYISLTDLRTAVQPLVTLSKPRRKIQTVALDPGHGGRDRGFYAGSRFEKNYTLLLAQEVKSQLARLGLKAVLTRSTDDYVELSDRPDRAKEKNADLFISLHFNSAGSGNSDAQGVETYCVTPVGARSTNAQGISPNAGATPGNLYNDQSLALGYLLQRNLVRNLALEDRGVRRARFEVLREAEMPAVLIEGGFMSHPKEGARIADPVFRRRMAKSIAEAIVAYKKAVEG